MLILNNSKNGKTKVAISRDGANLHKYDNVTLDKSIAISGIYIETDEDLKDLDKLKSFKVEFGPLKGRVFKLYKELPAIEEWDGIKSIKNPTINELKKALYDNFSYASLPTKISFSNDTEGREDKVNLIISQTKRIDKSEVTFKSSLNFNENNKLSDCCFYRNSIKISFSEDNNDAMYFLNKTRNISSIDIKSGRLIMNLTMSIDELIYICSLDGVEVYNFSEEKYINC